MTETTYEYKVLKSAPVAMVCIFQLRAGACFINWQWKHFTCASSIIASALQVDFRNWGILQRDVLRPISRGQGGGWRTAEMKLEKWEKHATPECSSWSAFCSLMKLHFNPALLNHSLLATVICVFGMSSVKFKTWPRVTSLSCYVWVILPVRMWKLGRGSLPCSKLFSCVCE